MHIVTSALLALTLSSGVVPVLDPDQDGPPTLTLPGGPTIPMPPGAEVFGPTGPNSQLFPPRAFPPRGGAAPPPARADAAPLPEQSPDERRKQRVDDLFRRLAAAKDETEATAIQAMLDRIWLQSGSDTADLLMTRVLSAMQSKDLPLAESLLDKIVALQPGWPEAWNERATVYYLDGQDVQSMTDISHVLTLEPRHFGALSGMGFILHRNGDDKGALMVLRRAAAINPRNKELNDLIQELTPDVEGRDL